MKSAAFLLFIVCTIVFSEAVAQNTDPNIYTKVIQDTVILYHDNFRIQCGAKIAFTVNVFSDSIQVIEKDTSSIFTRCSCYFNLKVFLMDLKKGKYTVSVYYDYPTGSSYIRYFIGSTILDLGSDLNGINKYFGTQSACLGSTDLDDDDAKPVASQYKIYNNYPNPFNPSTRIKYDLDAKCHVKITIYDLMGRELEVLKDEEQNSGQYEITYQPQNLSSGVYLYKIQAGDRLEMKQMVFLK